MTLLLKRAYDSAEKSDGYRVLVDRLWPRGVSKAKAGIDEWRRELAPSVGLRKWFGHDPERWAEFRRRYLAELKPHRGQLRELATRARKGKVTLLYAAKDEAHNNAIVLAGEIKRLR